MSVKPRGRPRKKSSDTKLNRLRALWRTASRQYYERNKKLRKKAGHHSAKN